MIQDQLTKVIIEDNNHRDFKTYVMDTGIMKHYKIFKSFKCACEYALSLQNTYQVNEVTQIYK